MNQTNKNLMIVFVMFTSFSGLRASSSPEKRFNEQPSKEENKKFSEEDKKFSRKLSRQEIRSMLDTSDGCQYLIGMVDQAMARDAAKQASKNKSSSPAEGSLKK